LKLLIFVGTEGKHHNHFGQGKYLANLFSDSSEITVDFSQDYDILTDGLDVYDTILLYTDVGTLTDAQEEGLLGYVNRGGGFFGLHTAAASFLENRGYHSMLNALFLDHSRYMDFDVTIADPTHPIARGISDFKVTDELYYLKHDSTRSYHLMTAYDPTKDEFHVMAFVHQYGLGRVFYFALGHDMAVMENPSFQEIIRRGAWWTARERKNGRAGKFSQMGKGRS
jgi:type 1 glutamine amidotransferase